jgi:uncharacterized protein YjiS (DUF1127 family)
MVRRLVNATNLNFITTCQPNSPCTKTFRVALVQALLKWNRNRVPRRQLMAKHPDQLKDISQKEFHQKKQMKANKEVCSVLQAEKEKGNSV